MSKFILQYLPLFFEDLENIVLYIRDELKNPKAANHLIDEVEHAILERQKSADSFEVYHSVKERKYPYYRIYVNNYVIYYVIIDTENEKIMEVRRILYKGRDRDTLV